MIQHVRRVSREDDVHRLDRLALAGDQVAVLIALEGPVGHQPLHLRAGRVPERLVRREAGDEIAVGVPNRSWAYTVCRYWWTMLTVAEPSPTAAATRLPEPWRASPAQKMPGTLVSNR